MQLPRYTAFESDARAACPLMVSPQSWRALLTRPLLPPQSSVLVVGARPIEAADLLVNLAYDVCGWCEEPDAVFSGRRACPRAEFEFWRPQSRRLPSQQKFDLVLAFSPVALRGNLYSCEARRATAQLLAAARPQARVVLLTTVAAESHTVDCWRRHLTCFPGEVREEVLGPRRHSWWPDWNLRLRDVRQPLLAISLQTPAQPLSLTEWERFAEQGLLTDSRTCCDQVAVRQPVPEFNTWRRAG